MFTGLIEEVGTVVAAERRRASVDLTVRASGVLADARIGDSLAINGACLTIVGLLPDGFRATAVEETVARTTLGDLAVGSPVNLERPLQVGGRLGGHLVNGHVDGVGMVAQIQRRERSSVPFIECEPELCRYLVEKGWIAMDGVSLTVVSASSHGFTVSLIPHTQEVTTLGRLRVGQRVNLEVDLLAKYVERLLRLPTQSGSTSSGVTETFLSEHGFR